MKANYFKALFLLVAFLTASSSFSQAIYSERYPKMRFGLNMGGLWQTNDILKNKAGFAGGVTLEKVLNKKDDAILGFSLGIRYLGGYSSGYDNRKNIALKSNTALNTADSTTNYFTSPGYFYNNYRTAHNEGAFELKMNFPKFEKRTSLVFHLYGGIGAAKYNTKINALDFSSKYSFSNFSTNQPSLSEIQKMYDNSWETPADGNAGNGNVVIAPSGGVGFGVRFSKNFSWVIEHRVTFPRVDILDGHQWKDDVTKTDRNDYYHYTSAHFIFTFYGGGKGNISTNNNTNITNNTQTNLNNTPKPIINVYTPVTNPHTTTSNIQQVSGNIKYVTSYSGVSITLNGVPVSNFDFNPNNGSFGFNANLNPGINNVTITATNSAGQDSEQLQINYSAPQFTNQPIANELPPKVVINYPSNNYVSTLSSTNVNAVISNISSSANVAVAVNSVAISNFNYNAFSGALSFTAPLNPGNNSIVVSAFNTAGNDAQQIFVKYSPTTTQAITPKAEPKPVVSFHNPSSTPYESLIKNFNITAHVSNVTSANQLNVLFNGAPVTNFTFNSYGFVNFNANLNVGSNSVIITGTNTAGSDTKTVTINYKETGNPPIVKIIDPSQSPLVTESINYNVVAKIENVQNQNDINVLVNNAVVPFTYNTVNQTATIQTNLNAGKNIIVVTATNSYGSDTKTQLIERSIKLVRKPLVTVITPAVSPLNSFVNSQQVVAQVLNVTSASEIQVTGQNNLSIPFNYDATTQQISFSVNLVTGANVYVIKASNSAGTDSKSVTINYTPKTTPILEKPPVVNFVNPATSPFTTFDASMSVIATVANVSTQQAIVVKLNNANVNFTFNATTKEVLIPSTLNLGVNSIIVTASNLAGSDSKTQIIERKEMERCFLSPVVNIVIPSTSPYNTMNATENVRAEVLNVTGASSIQVTNQSGQSVNFTYDATSHYVNFVANLTAGSNIYKIKATNNVDAVSQSVTIIYTKVVSTTQTPVKINKPVVTYTAPSQVNTIIQAQTQTVNATVANVNDISGVSVQVNGQAYSSFTFANGVVSFVLNCNPGSNTVNITGTNAAGSDSKTIFVNRIETQPVVPLPVVTFTNPSALSTITSNSTQAIQASIRNVTSASQVLVQVNGAAVTNFTFLNGVVSFTANLNVGNNTVYVKGTNTAGSDNKTISIIYEKPEVAVVINPPVITYVVPNGSTLTTQNSSENIRMMIAHISNSNQINVKVNGNDVTNFVFLRGVVSFTAPLSLGVNTVLVSATNTAGTASKQVLITYELPPIPPPVVTILTPSPNTTVSSASQSVEATITNVLSSSQLQVTINGNGISGFNFTNGNLSFVSSLDAGPNVITIKATNASGTDTKSVTITYTLPVEPVRVQTPPVVTFFNPSAPVTNVSVASHAISATVTHVVQNQVSVKVNGSAISNFTFANSTVNFVAQLIQGANNIEISATNVDGTDTKSVTINYTPPPPVVNPPIVSFVNPSTNTSTLNNVQNVSANVTEVTSSSQVSVLVNNSPISNFSFVAGNVSFVAPLVIGANTVKVTGTNSGGTDSKTITITRQAPPAPLVTITNPSSNPYTSNDAIVNVTASVLHVAGSSEISVSSNGTSIPFTYNGATNVVNFSYTLSGNTTFVVSASNANGSDSKNLVVNYSAQTVVNDPKIRICHYPNGPTSTPISIDILASEWPSHEAHGDSEGNCVVINPPVVSFTNPSSTSTSAQSATQSILARVTNVTTLSQVSVLVNNSPVTNFTLTNGNVAFVANLLVGANTVKVTGTNTGGTDSKTITITRQAPPAPSVTITNPNINPYTSANANISVAANVINVASASEISVKVGTAVVPFTYNAANNGLSFNYTLTGTTTFVIAASNANGSDSKSLVVNYTAPVADPEITICHKPPGNPTNTQQLTIPQSAWAAHQAHGDVLGECPPAVTTPTVTPDPEITICHKPPGNPTNTQQLTIPQSAWAAHQAHGDVLGTCPAVVSPPIVSITNPSSANSTTQNNVQSIAANVTNVSTSSQVAVTLNNSPITNFTFANGNISFNAALSLGTNTVKVTGTNEGGTDSKTIIITRQAPPAPAVTITNPSTNPYTSTAADITINATVANVAYASEIAVTANGAAVQFNYNVSSDALTLQHTLTGNTTFVISASNANGSDSKSLVVNYTAPVADPEITICHKPPGNPTNTQQLTIPQSAWPAHQAHGDELGACPTPTVTPNNGNNNGGGNGNNGGNNNDPQITICHKPPGNPENTQELTIPQSAWPAHQAHGDDLGPCPKVKGNGNGNGNGNRDNSTPGTILNGIKGIMNPKTNNNTGQPVNTTPKTNTQPANTTPKTNEPKKDEPKVTPRTVQPTTTAPATVAPKPATPVKATTPSTVTEGNNGTSAPRTIKPR